MSAMNVTSPIRHNSHRHIFSNSDTLSARYSLSSEHGFMPINLPDLARATTISSQQGSWRGTASLPSM